MAYEEFEDALFESEYDDAFPLLGVDDPDQQEELLGRIWRNPRSRKRLVKKVFHKPAPVIQGKTNSRQDFQKRFRLLPKESRTALLKKRHQLVDTTIYIVKEISGSKMARVMNDDDNKVVALCNLSGGKLEKGNNFMLKGMQLLYGVAAEGEDHRSVNFGVIPDFIRNGEYEFTANGSVLIPSRSLEVFDTTGMQTRRGYNELVNPKMLETQQPLEFEAEWGIHAPERAYLKLIMHGTSSSKN